MAGHKYNVCVFVVARQSTRSTWRGTSTMCVCLWLIDSLQEVHGGEQVQCVYVCG